MEKKAILLMFVCCFLYYSQRLFSYYAYSYLLCFLVVIHYCEIPISTKGWPSLKMRGMPTTCVVFFPHQLFLKKLRLIIWPETILSTLIFLFLFSKAIRLCVCLHTSLGRWRKWSSTYASIKFHCRSIWQWWIFRCGLLYNYFLRKY